VDIVTKGGNSLINLFAVLDTASSEGKEGCPSTTAVDISVDKALVVLLSTSPSTIYFVGTVSDKEDLLAVVPLPPELLINGTLLLMILSFDPPNSSAKPGIK
jgi:hypothetical protein